MRNVVGVKALARNADGKFLLLQRATPMLDGTLHSWDIPGGRREPEDKTLLDTVAREGFQEAGVRLEGLEPFHLQVFRPVEDLTVVRFTYIGFAVGAVTLSHEHADFRFVSAGEGLQLPVDMQTREVLEIAQRSGY